MIMRAAERRLGEIVILDISLSDTKELLCEVDATFNAVLDRGEKNIIMNFEKLTFFDASCIAFISASFSTAKKVDAQIKFVIPHPGAKEILRICKLDTVIESFDNEAEAVASFVDLA